MSNDHDHTRIPDELIDAALDGEVCDELHDEIVHALRYDKTKHEEVAQTLTAIGSLRDMPHDMPDLQIAVLNKLDDSKLFLSAPLRRWVRTGRLAFAAAFLLGLMVVSAIQTVSPRFATIGTPSTPIEDVAKAVGDDSRELAGRVEHDAPVTAGVISFVFDPTVSISWSNRAPSQDQIARADERVRVSANANDTDAVALIISVDSDTALLRPARDRSDDGTAAGLPEIP